MNIDKYREFEDNTLTKEENDDLERYKIKYITPKTICEATKNDIHGQEYIMQAYKDYPLSGFYKCNKCLKPIRILEYHYINNKVSADVCKLATNSQEYTCPMQIFALSDLIKINKWSSDDIKYITYFTHRTQSPDINKYFRHPLGFTELIKLAHVSCRHH